MAEQKKPNTFTKGMQADVDANLLLSDSYRKGHNVRSMSKSDNSFTLKNVTGHKLATNISVNSSEYTITTANLNSYCAPPLAVDSVSYTVKIKNGSTTLYTFTSLPTTINNTRALNSAMLQLFSQVTEANNFYVQPIVDGDTLKLVIISFDSVSDITIEFFATTTTAAYNSGDDNYNPVVKNVYTWNPSVTSASHDIVGLVSFSDYICIFTTTSSYSYVWKAQVSVNGNFSSAILKIVGNFGFTAGRLVKIESSEENEHYHRVYWIDGDSPLRSINLKESMFYYISLQSTDLDVFKASPLNPAVITGVNSGGVLDCGSYRYCYRLTTKGGNSSLISPITNPVSVYKTSKSASYHNIEGGGESEPSGKYVSFSIAITDTTYESIQVIALRTISNEGAIDAHIIIDDKLYGTTFNGQHTGGETKTAISISQILSNSVSWTTGKDLKTKDNRLFVSNLTNASNSIDADFRVVSYNSSGAAFSTTTNYNNPDLRDANLYYAGTEGNNKYKFSDSNANKFGASSADFSDTTKNGVRVSFRLKAFTLDSKGINDQAGVEKESSNNPYLLVEPPFYGLESKTGDDGFYDNYKNPVFANKHVGYQRNEVYRFAILFYDLSGQATFSYPIGDIRFPKATDVYSPIQAHGLTDYVPTKCVTSSPDEVLGKYRGYIMHPRFEVNLSADLRSNISGYSIVRAEREEKDKMVLFNGLLSSVIRYSDNVENRSMRNKLGVNPVSVFHPIDGIAYPDMFTIDSPECVVNGDQYNNVSGDKLARSYIVAAWENDTTNSGAGNGYYSPITFRSNASPHNKGYALRFDPNTNNVFSSWYNSAFTKLFQVADHGSFAASEKLIHFGTNVNSFGTISNNETTSGLIFKNGGRTNIDANYEYVFPSGSSGWNSEPGSDAAFTFAANDTTFINLAANNTLVFTNSIVNNKGALLKSGKHRSIKHMAQMIRDVSGSAYGGNSVGAFKNTRYISTGSFVNNVNQATTTVDVFGGDTFVNMFSLKKMNTPFKSYLSSDSFEMPHQAIIVPIESTINLDFRSGVYFGKGEIQPGFQDDYLYNNSYSAVNNSKLFLEKPTNFLEVSKYENMVAASNLKINGSSSDAYTKFDANEFYELDNSYGPIYNLIKLRNELFTIQTTGVSKLSINPRVVVSNDDVAAVTIATGTGSVIERADYVDTKYGSQHFNNSISTNTSAYWYDDANSSLCKLVFGQGVVVQDLGLTTQNSSLLDVYKDTAIADSPLTGDGVSFHWNQRHDEVVCCIHSSTKTSIVYSELMDIIVGTRDESSCMSVNLAGETYSVGYKVLSNLNDSKVFKHDGESVNQNAFYEDANTSAMEVTFVINENVYTSKVFDKLVLYLSGNGNAHKFTTFEFVDSLGNTISNTGTNLGKMRAGKHILPIRDLTGSPASTTKMKGNYLIVTIKSSATEEVELFSALVHHRTTNI